MLAQMIQQRTSSHSMLQQFTLCACLYCSRSLIATRLLTLSAVWLVRLPVCLHACQSVNLAVCQYDCLSAYRRLHLALASQAPDAYIEYLVHIDIHTYVCISTYKIMAWCRICSLLKLIWLVDSIRSRRHDHWLNDCFAGYLAGRQAFCFVRLSACSLLTLSKPRR